MSGAAARIEVRGLAVAPAGGREPLLRGIDFAVAPGECVALVGRSGAGKTTLLRTLALALAPHAGEIALDGRPVAALPRRALRAARMRIALVAQKHDLVEPLRVDKNVMAGALGRWSALHALRFLLWSSPAERAEAAAALAQVGLADKLLSPTAALSGGEQQRVAIARALVQAPAVLLADEPVASLDPALAEQVLALLTRLARERGMALVAALHQPELARRHCDRTLLIEDGRVVPLAQAAR